MVETGERGKMAKLAGLFRVVRNWPRTLLDHLHLTPADYVCHLRNGCRFQVRGGGDDRHVIFEVFVNQIYSVPIRPGDTVVDIGAHIGCFTVWAAKQGARVFSFEPFPANFAALQRNVSLNDVRDAFLFQTAVTGKRESKPLVIPDDPRHTGRYSLHPGRGTRILEVSCISLDDVVRENQLEQIDVLKIDCQGSEYELLYGASAQTLAKICALIVECETFDEPADWSITALRTFLEKQRFVTRTRENLLYARRSAS